MKYEVIWDEKARDFLRTISRDNAQRIIKKVNTITEDPRHYLEFLVGIDCYKLRIGDFRTLIDIDEHKHEITVLIIGDRKNIYTEIQRIKFRKK